MMTTHYLVTVTGRERRQMFEAVFGAGTVYVKSPHPVLAMLPGYDEPQPVYLMDMSSVTPKQWVKLVDFLVARFKLERAEVEEMLAEDGLPILASGCLVAMLNPLGPVENDVTR